MWWKIICLVLVASSTWAREKTVVSLPLDARNVYTIKVWPETPCTLVFPSEIVELTGSGVIREEAIASGMIAPLALSYMPNRSWVTVRATDLMLTITNTTQLPKLNVVLGKTPYVLNFELDKENASRSVTFYWAQERRQGAFGGVSISPSRILGLIDQAKAWGLLATQYPEIEANVDTRRPLNRTLYRNFNVILDQCWRWDVEDTVVFRILFENLSTNVIYYEPQSLGVRVSQEVYWQSVSDASGIMPPRTMTPAYFAVTGHPNGGRNNLSLFNTFEFVVARVDETNAVLSSRRWQYGY